MTSLTRAYREIASKFPDRRAVTDGTNDWSYGQLAARKNQIARWLAERGIGKGSVVAIHAERNALTIAAMLGVADTGAAFTMLDADYPAARLAEHVRIAGASAFLETSATRPASAQIRGAIAHVLDLSSANALTDDATPELDVAIAPDDRAYIAFTSGTTGTPKAIVGTHAPVTHFVAWQTKTFGIMLEDRFSALSGLAHDPFLRDVLTPLSVGASLHVPPQSVRLEPDGLARWIEEQRITVCHLTPSLGDLLMQAREPRMPDLRLAFFGGERLRGELVEAMRRAAPNAKFVNFYGTTETPQAMSYHVVEPGELGPVSIGRGIEGVELLVITEDGKLAPPGVEGEIWVRTPYLAEGYLAGQAGGFATNPLTNDPKDRAYRTGDRGMVRGDGEVDVLGRADDQVKVRGFRVELGEVERAIASDARVTQVAVVLRDSQTLVAYVSGRGLDRKQILASVRERLPNYMVPSTVFVLGSLPLTPNGKIDRHSLPALERASRPPSAAPPPAKAGRNDVRGTITAIWCEVLDVAEVGPHDNFFDVGGHSLNATLIATRIRDALGVDLPVRMIFEAPTVAELAARIGDVASSGKGGAAAASPPPLSRSTVASGSLLSYWQDSALAYERSTPGSNAWLTPMRIRLRGPLDTAALERAARTMVERQDALRQVIGLERNAKPALAKIEDVPFDTLDARKMSAADLDALIAERVFAPFARDGKPLIRFLLLSLADDDHVLCVAWHALVHDATGHAMIGEELMRTYEAAIENRSLAPLPIRFVDVAAWERAWFDKGKGKDLVAVAKKRIEGLKPLTLPTDKPRRGRRAENTVGSTFEVDAEATERFRRICTDARGTLAMGLVAASAAVISRWAGAAEVPFLSPYTLRGNEATKGILGHFGNWVTMRIATADDATFGDVLESAKVDATSAMASSTVPASLVYGAPNPFGIPLSKVIFNSPQFDDKPPEPMIVGPLTATFEGIMKPHRVRSDIVVRVFPFRGRIVGAIYADADVYEEATTRVLADRLANVLRTATPDARISDLAR